MVTIAPVALKKRTKRSPSESGNGAEISRGTPVSPSSLLEGREQERGWDEMRLGPDQFFVPAQQSAAAYTGERLLMFAVLQEAVHTYLRYRSVHTRRGRRLFEETRGWFWSRESSWLYAFESICQYLHLDPNYIRRGLEPGARSISKVRNSIRVNSQRDVQPCTSAKPFAKAA